MALKWVRIANLKGPTGAGDAVALVRFGKIEDALVKTDRTDYVKGSDLRALQYTPGDDYSIPFADRDGYMAGGFTANGRLALFKPMILPANAVQPSAIAGMTSLDPSTGYVAGALDKEGYISYAVRTDGAFRVFKGDGGVASRTKIAAIGDSLVRGYTGATAWDVADSWPSKLAEKAPGVTVENLGIGGNSIDEIRLRIGAMDFWVTSATGAIPGEGPVALTTKQKIGFVDSNTFDLTGYLAGVHGTLSRTASGITFTRSSPGEGFAVDGPLRFNAGRADYSGHTAIVWAGRNDVSFDVTGPESSVAEHVLASTLELVEWLTPRIKQVIVVGPTNRVDEPRGTAKYDTVMAINKRLAELLPGKYMDVRSWLVNRAIYDAGLTPTAADLKAISEDAPPPQIMDGGSHYNKPIAPLLATKFYARLTEKGFI